MGLLMSVWMEPTIVNDIQRLGHRARVLVFLSVLHFPASHILLFSSLPLLSLLLYRGIIPMNLH